MPPASQGGEPRTAIRTISSGHRPIQNGQINSTDLNGKNK